jgi:hypothetical protein
MLYVLGVLAATVTIPLASMLNGPVVNGVTLVLVVALRCCLTYHLSMRSMPLLPYCLMQQLPMDRLLHRLDCLLPLYGCSGITFAGVTFNLLMDWLRIIGR